MAFAFLKQHPEMAKELAEVVQKRIDGLEEDIKNDEISGFDYRHQTLQNAEAIKNRANQIIERDSNNIEHDSSTKTSKPKTIDELIGIAKTMAENDKKDSQGNDDKKFGQKKDTDGPGGL